MTNRTVVDAYTLRRKSYLEDERKVSKLIGVNSPSLVEMISFLVLRKINFSVSCGPDKEPLITVGETTRNFKNYTLVTMLAHVISLELCKEPACEICRGIATRKVMVGSLTCLYCVECFVKQVRNLDNFSTEII